jgi:RHS repeat-associated protein
MLGSSRTMVQAGQTSVCCDADFYPFGGERDIVGTCSQSYKFEGKERDTETYNDDFGARYYSSRFGRWLSADWSSVPVPVAYANLINPQTLNLYAMVSDNPETFADLDGHFWSPGDWFASLLNPVNDTPQQASTTSNDQNAPSAQSQQAEAAQNQQAQQKKLDDLSNVVENETSSLKADPNAKAGQAGSAENQAAGQQAIAEIANRILNAEHPNQVASSTLKDSEAAGLNRGDSAALDAHARSRTAAGLALGGSNISNGAMKYRTRVGTNVKPPVGKTRHNRGTPVSQHYGPFVEGHHKVVIVVAP